MSLDHFFKWCDASAVGVQIRSTTWEFPLIETIHILALAVLLGSILMIDFRLLGVLKRIPVSKMESELHSYINVSLVIILITGVLLFLSEAYKAYGNAAFFPKLILLAAAMIHHYTFHRKAVSSQSPSGPRWGKVVAVVSLALWFGVGIAGRAIGFV